MYAKIINEETKQCEVGIGTNTAFYESIGMTDMDVEQGYDGAWYVKGYAPSKPMDVLAQEKRAERDAAINSILWRVERYSQQKQLGIATTDSENEYVKILQYIQYLRDLPEQAGFPNVEIMTFEQYVESITQGE